MRTKRRHRLVMVLLAMAISVGPVACDDNPSVVAPVMDEPAVLHAMEAAIQDEFRAELIYEKVLDKFGSVRPFVNIIGAEVRHSEALARLYVIRGLPVPESRWASDDIPVFSSMPDACRAGVVAEIENAEIYSRYLELPLPSDVRLVFENNRAASLDKHLPAFERCS